MSSCTFGRVFAVLVFISCLLISSFLFVTKFNDWALPVRSDNVIIEDTSNQSYDFLFQIQLNDTDGVESHSSIVFSLSEYLVKYKRTDEYTKKLKAMGLEPTSLHSFKSPFVINPTIWDDSVPKPPGVRKTKIISCYNCPSWFTVAKEDVGYNRDFKKCPYSECVFDTTKQRQNKADLVLFFAVPRPPASMPPRPRGQIWALLSYEPPWSFGFPGRPRCFMNVFTNSLFCCFCVCCS